MYKLYTPLLKFIIQLIFIKLTRCCRYSDEDTIKSQTLTFFYLFALIDPFGLGQMLLFRTDNTYPNLYILLLGHLSVAINAASKFSLTIFSILASPLCMILGLKKEIFQWYQVLLV